MSGSAIRGAGRLAGALALALSTLGTGARAQETAPELEPPPHAHPEIPRDLLEARRRGHSPSDGTGHARLVEGGPVVAGGAGRWRIEYTAGAEGVAEGGAVYLQVSPFWGWSTPQVSDPRYPGFTVVTTDADGVELEPLTVDRQLLAVTLAGRALVEGERVVFDYGAGEAGARADDYAEDCSRFWIAVDGDGDGVRAVLADSPCVEVLPGPPWRAILHVPSVVRPGERLAATVAVLDAAANAVREVSGAVELRWDTADGPAFAGALELEHGGALRIDLPAPDPGLHRLVLRLALGDQVLEAESNPLEVSPRAPRILWGDLHGHSAESDGTGTPDGWWRYARDVAALDLAALTDHDHWGLLPLDEHPERWAELVAAAGRAERPGRFLALPGYEWTSWLWGHHHVLYFGDETPLVSSLDEASDTPQQLWAALAGLEALVVPHHPAGGPVAVDWRIPPDPRLEPVVEVCSAHGCSEAPDAPRPIYSSVPGTWTRDALARGYRLGQIASGDGHDGHPGLAHLGPQYPTGGVAAILAERPARDEVLDALRSRRAYATSGPRAILRFALGATPMGAELAAPADGAEVPLYVAYAGTAPVREVQVVRSGRTLAPFPGEGRRDVQLGGQLGGLEPGEWVYVRVVQTDDHAAWSSPVFVR